MVLPSEGRYSWETERTGNHHTVLQVFLMDTSPVHWGKELI